MDKPAIPDHPGKTLTLTASKPRATSVKAAESSSAPLGDARDAAHSGEATPDTTPANGARRRRVVIAAAVIAIAALAIGGRYYAWAVWHESTDDAFIDGHVVQVAPQVAGRVLRVLVTDNQPVKAGALIVEIDPADYKVKLDQAVASQVEARGRLGQAEAERGVTEAGHAQAEADIVAAKADAANARADLARYQATTSGAVSKQAVDSAKTAAERTAAQLVVAQKKASAAAAQVELARSQIAAAAADVSAADAAVEQARLQLSYTQIRAAEAGRVTVKSVEPGDYVQIGQALLALVSDDVWVEANFKETQLTYMRPGQRALVYVDAYPGRPFHGHVDSIQAGSGARFSLLPPENATGNYVKVVQRVPVKVVFDDRTEENLLGPGMSVVPEVSLR
jgi:membrane fusion protein (multidrug efflux system)